VNHSDTFVYVLNSNLVFATNVVSVIDTSTNTVVATIPGAGFGLGGQIALNPIRPRAYVVTGGPVQVIDTITNTVTATVNLGGSNGTSALAVNPAGTYVYVTDSVSNNVFVIDAITNGVIAVVPMGLIPRAVVLNPVGTIAYVMNWAENSVSAIDTATNTVATTISLGSPGSAAPVEMVMNPADTFLYVISNKVGQGIITVIDIATNAVIASFPYGSPPAFGSGSLAVKPDGTRVYLANTPSNAVSVVTGSTSTFIATVPVGFLPVSIAVGPVVAAQLQRLPVPALSAWAMLVVGLLVAALGIREVADAQIRRL
jgi:YVTN family beta-propeller protein